MNAQLGICIVGCGYMGQIHADRWSKVPGARITAVVDLDAKRAERLAFLYRLETHYLDYREAILLPEVDVVSVCIPTRYHAELTIASAEQGKHILCEKPIALTLESADEMIAAAERNQVKLGLGFMRRHSPVLNQLKDRLTAGEFGRPLLYHASDIRELRSKREMHDAEVNGGPLIDMGVHLFDLWSYIFDSPPVSVSAQGLQLAAGRPEIAHVNSVAVDTATVLVKYASGDIGTFVVSWGLPPKVVPPGQKDQLYGSRSLAEVVYGTNRQELTTMVEGGSWNTLAISHEDMYQNQIDRFAAWIREDVPFPATGSEGKSALRVALAALESIQTGATVRLG